MFEINLFSDILPDDMGTSVDNWESFFELDR